MSGIRLCLVPRLLLRLGVELAFLAVTATAQQQQIPHAGYVYPAGGRQGTSFEVIVGGPFLDGVKTALLSGAGVQATVVDHFKPLTPAQAAQLRDQVKELSEKPNPTAEDRQKSAEIRAKLQEFVRRPTTPAIAETVRVRIALAPGAVPGERELRLVTPNGLTNPVIFSIGQLPEVSRPPARGEGQLPNAQAGRGRGPARPAPEPPMEITLPVLVNGQIPPGGVDRFRFQATKGQHIVIAAKARELLPYISDAVPGWFQATLALADSSGREVQYADHFLFHPDPVLYYEIPQDGAYTLEIHDSIYRGREDFVYRVEVGELPIVTGIFPLGERSGKRTAVELTGWNLPAGKLTQDTKGKPAGVYPIAAHSGPFLSNPPSLAADTLPETLEKEPNDRRETRGSRQADRARRSPPRGPESTPLRPGRAGGARRPPHEPPPPRWACQPTCAPCARPTRCPRCRWRQPSQSRATRAGDARAELPAPSSRSPRGGRRRPLHHGRATPRGARSRGPRSRSSRRAWTAPSACSAAPGAPPRERSPGPLHSRRAAAASSSRRYAASRRRTVRSRRVRRAVSPPPTWARRTAGRSALSHRQ